MACQLLGGKLSATLLAVAAFLLLVLATAPAYASGNGGAALGPGSTAHHYGIGEVIVTYTDPTRRMWIPGRGAEPRELETIIRYPAATDQGPADVMDAPPATGHFPLVVFAEGFDITPAPYAALLRSWVRAGYVVAAPIFPLTNPYAVGGPNESDLVNQPTDMSFVITKLLAAAARHGGILAGLVDSHRIAVAGQSDGGSTALAAAYNRNYFDRRIDAAMIFSGATIPS